MDWDRKMGWKTWEGGKWHGKWEGKRDGKRKGIMIMQSTPVDEGDEMMLFLKSQFMEEGQGWRGYQTFILAFVQ